MQRVSRRPSRARQVVKVEFPRCRWSALDAMHLFRGAMRAAMTRPLGPRDVPSELRALWPADVVRFRQEDWPGETRPPRFQIAPRILAQSDQVLPYLYKIAPPDGTPPSDPARRDFKIVMGRLCKVRWYRLSRADGRSRAALHRVFDQGLADLAAELDRAGLDPLEFLATIDLSDFPRRKKVSR